MLIGLLVSHFLLFSSVLQGQRSSLDRQRLRARYSLLLLREVDLTPLMNEGLSRGLGLSEKDLEKVVGSNFRFILFNRLNESSFAVSPPPKLLMEKIVKILQLDTRIGTLIQEGRRLAASGNSGREERKMVRDVADSAKKLGKIFQDYFLDLRDSPYQFNFRGHKARDVLFIHYLLQLDRLNRRLGQQLDDYFFNPAPGVVDLSEFDESSISTLSKSIVELSSLTDKGLRR